MKLSAQAKRMMQVIVVVTVVAAIASLVYYQSQKAIPFLLGLLIGAVTSLIRVILLERLVNKFVAKKKLTASVQFGHLGRLALAFIALLVGAVVEGISLIGVIVGVFSYQLGTYALHSTLTTSQRDPLHEAKPNATLDENKPDTEDMTE